MCRLAQQRECTASALAAGMDPIRLQSRVQLLDEAFQGQYMIGVPSLYPCGHPIQREYESRAVQTYLYTFSRSADSIWTPPVRRPLACCICMSCFHFNVDSAFLHVILDASMDS